MTNTVRFTLYLERDDKEIEVECVASLSTSHASGPGYSHGGMPAESECDIKSTKVGGKEIELSEAETDLACEKAWECDGGS